MAVTTRGYRHALFVRIKDFDLSELAGLSHVTKEKGGYTIKLGTRNARYFVHSVRSGLVALETDDKKTRVSAVRDIASFARGRGKILERATLERTKALEYLRSFEEDGMLAQGKLHIYFRDTATIDSGLGSYDINRTKIVFNNKNVAEARKLSTDLTWEVGGANLTIERGDDKHYGIVRFDANPTARVAKVAAPMHDDLHELLAKRLVDLLVS